MKVLFLVLLSLCLTIAIAGRQDPFAGTWSGGGLVVVLEAKGDGYVGKATLEGITLEVVASKVSGTKIQGTYSVLGETAPFTGTLRDGKLIIEAAGETHTISRSGDTGFSKGPFKDAGWGIELKAPQGWLGRSGDGMFLFGSETEKGAIVVIPIEAKSVDELREGAKAGFQEEGVVLKLSGEPRVFSSSGLSAEFAGTAEGTEIRAAAVGLVSPHGVGAVVLALTDKESYNDSYRKLAEETARGIKFFKPQVPDFVQDWKKSLAGTRLTYLESYSSGGGSGGTSSKEVIELFPDGSCSFRSSSLLSIDVGSSAYSSSRSSGSGTWKVTSEGQTALLKLTLGNGTVKSYKLSYENKKLFLNGYRYFWTPLTEGE